VSGQVHYDRKHPFRAKATKYGLMLYSLNDTFIGRSLDQYGEWTEFEIDLLTLIGPDDTVIDVGANIGTHTLAFAAIAKSVHAFEPQPRLFRILAANLALNGIDNVVAHKMAVGSRCGQISIAYLPPDDAIFNFGALPLDAPTGQQIPASIVTVDSLGLSPSLIKIDVEGMEGEVIAGASETIKRCSPAIYLENNGQDSKSAAAALAAINYRAWWSLGPYFNPKNHFANPVNIWPDVMPSSNLIALPHDPDVRFDLPEFLGPDDSWINAQQRMTGTI